MGLHRVELPPAIQTREIDAHKGTFGHALIVGGSRGMSGAVSLSGAAAIRSGAGLVTLAVPDRCLETVAGFSPSCMTVPLPDDSDGRLTYAAISAVENLGSKATGVAMGPGLGRSRGVSQVVAHCVKGYAGPMVVDADGLNALAEDPSVCLQAAGPRVLTPHIGEFRRLAGNASLSPADCRAAAHDFAARYGVIVVLKGPETLVTNGSAFYENTTGNPGMATGGTGDVLTGVIVALMAQGYTPIDAAILGVYVHGLAGDIAVSKDWSLISLSAEVLVGYLNNAFLQLENKSPSE